MFTLSGSRVYFFSVPVDSGSLCKVSFSLGVTYFLSVWYVFLPGDGGGVGVGGGFVVFFTCSLFFSIGNCYRFGAMLRGGSVPGTRPMLTAARGGLVRRGRGTIIIGSTLAARQLTC